MNNAQTVLAENKKFDKTHLAFGLISVLLIILLVFFVTFIQQAKEANIRSNLSYKHLDYSDKLIIQMLNIQTGARGYLITKNEEFLTPFLDGINNLEKILSSIERVWPDYLQPQQITDLEKNIDTVVENLALMIQTKNIKRSAKLEIYENSKSDMDDLKEKIINTKTIIRKSIKEDQLKNEGFLNSMKLAILLLSIIAFSLLFILFVQTLKRQKLVKAHALLIANENINLENIVSERTEELVDLASHMTTTNENEKKRIARELHDELGALLTAARMDTTWIKRNLKPKNDDPLKTRLDRMIDTIDKGIQVKREITDSLVPPLLRELGLIDAITAMTEDVPDLNPPKYILQLSSSLPDIDSDRELAIYRICQESLNNIRKYAKASTVTINLDLHNDNIQLDVVDDGVGFNLNNQSKNTHGVSGMRARAAMFKGKFNIESSVGEGTHINAIIPIHKNA